MTMRVSGYKMRNLFRVLATLACMAANAGALSATSTTHSGRPTMDRDGTVHVPAYSLPESSLLGTDARNVLRNERMHETEQPSAPNPCLSAEGADAAHAYGEQLSVPMASVGKIKVISVDYRQAPEYSFPSASEDVATVYRELLKTYEPANIGIYGCSAGGLLAAETIAWLQKEKLPLPGAVGMFCEGAAYWTEGDAGLIGTAHGWWSPRDTLGTNPYFKNTGSNDPLAFRARSARVMARFPPSLLIAGTRDLARSSVVYTHSLLVAQGAEARLHIWEGMGHGFFLNPDLPQSREVHSVVVKFFDSHLDI